MRAVSAEPAQPSKRSGSRRAAWLLATGMFLAALAGGFLAFLAPTLAEELAGQGDACTGPLAWVVGTLVVHACSGLAWLALLLGAALIVTGSLSLIRTAPARTT